MFLYNRSAQSKRPSPKLQAEAQDRASTQATEWQRTSNHAGLTPASDKPDLTRGHTQPTSASCLTCETAESHTREAQGSEPPQSRLVTFLLSIAFTCVSVLASWLIKLRRHEIDLHTWLLVFQAGRRRKGSA